MKSPSARYLTAYAVRCVLGTLIVLGAISGARVVKLKHDLSVAAAQLAVAMPEAALAQLQRTDAWIEAYPLLARRADYQRIQANVLLEDRASAQAYATAMATHAPRALASVASPWEKALVFPDWVANRLLGHFAPDLDVAPQAGAALLQGESYSARDMAHVRTSPPPPAVAQPAQPQRPGMPTFPDVAKTHTSTDTEATATLTATDSQEWGVTITPATSVYATDGKLLGHVPAGSLLTVSEHKQSTQGDLVVCAIMLNGKRVPAVIVKTKDTTLYVGSIATTTPRQRELCIQRANSLAQIVERRDALNAAAATRNPHAAAYAKAVAEYREFGKRVKSLREAYDKATGPRRMEIADALRELKPDERRIAGAYKAAKQANDAWKTENSDDVPDVEGDPQIQKLRSDVAALERTLEET